MLSFLGKFVRAERQLELAIAIAYVEWSGSSTRTRNLVKIIAYKSRDH